MLQYWINHLDLEDIYIVASTVFNWSFLHTCNMPHNTLTEASLHTVSPYAVV